MNFLKVLVYLYLLLRPFYFFSSGSIQISDFILIIGFLVFLIIISRNKTEFKNIIVQNKYYVLFLILLIFINLIYYIIYLDFGFILSTLYYIFNFFVILIFSLLLKDDKFVGNFNRIVKFNIFLQLFMCLFGLGSNWLGTIRYMGTFNDPNQFAYFILISYSFLFLLKQKLNDKTNLLIYLIICVYLILRSSSTGMLLGITVIALLSIVDIMKQFASFIRRNSKKIVLFLYLLLVGVTFLLINPQYEEKIYNVVLDTKIINRINEKIAKSNNSNSDKDLWHDRGYDIIFAYPKYMVYGAGQGKYDRFTELTGHGGEIHATLPSILFYYGIIPTLILLLWFYKKLGGLPFRILIVYIALFIESFTLLNQRQALFWIIMILGSTFRGEKNEQG